MVVCLQRKFTFHKHVRKLRTGCGRMITNYVIKNEDEPMIVVCVHKPGSRPLWYTRDVRMYETVLSTTLVKKTENSIRSTTIHMDQVTCVDCLSSGYYGVRELKRTAI